MAFVAKDANGNTIYIASTGAGTSGDPIVPVQTVTATGPLTDDELRASDVPVTLDGESVAVTGPLTDTQLRAADVKITLDSETVVLAAGTNNIGDVDIASFPTVTLTTISGVCDSAGANSLVAAPSAGNHHVLHAFQFAGKEAPTTLQNVLLKSDSTELWNTLITEIGAGEVIFFPPGQELHWGSAKAIVADLAEAKDVAYVLRYRTIAD